MSPVAARVDGVLGGGGFGDDVDAGFGLQYGAQSGPDDGVVVGQQQPDGACGHEVASTGWSLEQASGQQGGQGGAVARERTRW